MGGLVKLVLSLVESGFFRPFRQTAVSYTTIGLFALVGSGFAIAALTCALDAVWIYAEPKVGPAGAPLIVAGLLFALCLLAIVLARRAAIKPQQAPPTPAAHTLILEELTKLLSAHKGSVLASAVLAGLVAGSAED